MNVKEPVGEPYHCAESVPVEWLVKSSRKDIGCSCPGPEKLMGEAYPR